MRRLAGLAAAALLAAGCGTPSPDLFEVRRTGEDANADVTLLVSDGGTVTCNGGEPKALDSDRLLQARDLSRDLASQAALGLELEPEEGSMLRYSVRTADGTIAFSDTSQGRTPEMNRLVAFTKHVVENVCGIER